ncbi:MAG: thiamine phosphate synthase [Thalassolituus sp.]
MESSNLLWESSNLDSGMGLYALTDNIPHLKSLLALGVDTIQWRVKSPEPDYRQQTIEAIALCSEAGVPFWLNDDWKLAIDLAHDLSVQSCALTGVHLGQEDLLAADLNALREAGLCFGVSTHTEWEIARARALNPTYIAFGPVYTPLSKTLKYPPLGLERLTNWVSRFGQSNVALTCIGGITPANARAVAATGIPSLAVVTCLHPDGYKGLSQQENAKALHRALENDRATPITGFTTVTTDTTGTEYSLG